MAKGLTRVGVAIAAVWMVACLGEARLGGTLPSGGACGSVYLAGVESTFRLELDTHAAGASPSIDFEMYAPGTQPNGKILLTRSVVITLPAAFGFAGFDALGAGAAIGAWDFDYSQPNGTWDPLDPRGYDYRIPHYAIDASHAYADTFKNGAYDAGVDSTVAHTTGGAGEHVFTITLPSGGTNNGGFDPTNPCSYFDTDTRFTLPAGIVSLPQAPGDYDVTIVATSVDPDTGDADDQAGAAPTIYERTVPMHVPEPAAAAASAATALAIAALRRLRRRAR